MDSMLKWGLAAAPKTSSTENVVISTELVFSLLLQPCTSSPMTSSPTRTEDREQWSSMCSVWVPLPWVCLEGLEGEAQLGWVHSEGPQSHGASSCPHTWCASPHPCWGWSPNVPLLRPPVCKLEDNRYIFFGWYQCPKHGLRGKTDLLSTVNPCSLSAQTPLYWGTLPHQPF